MPFQNYLARTFRAAAIQRDAPASSGVYGLSNALEWVYVGETDNIQAKLLEHLNETGTLLKQRLPTGFNFELCSPDSRLARQQQLILELDPACNGRIRRRPVAARAKDHGSMLEGS